MMLTVKFMGPNALDQAVENLVGVYAKETEQSPDNAREEIWHRLERFVKNDESIVVEFDLSEKDVAARVVVRSKKAKKSKEK